jgi:hypothetical protein
MTGINLIAQHSTLITKINCGTSSPRLGGKINLSAFPYLQDFRCSSNDITEISGYENHRNLEILIFDNNKISGSIPNLANTNLYMFVCYTNQINGTTPNFSSGIQIVSIHTNELVGSIPILTGYQNLNIFHCFQNLLSGSIPNLSSNTNLTDFRCQSNFLSGSIPNLSACTKLNTFECDTQYGNTKITSFAGGSVSNTLGSFRAHNNQLTSVAVNAILAAFVAAGRTSANGPCILNLGGTNAPPTGQGLTDLNTLRNNRGWTVTVTP